tara:strand:- start:310 stop:4071 length:3762 start_codon:yes stop_codon:yes gene_type:complete
MNINNHDFYQHRPNAVLAGGKTMITQAKQISLVVLTALAASLFSPVSVHADDTEIFEAQADSTTTGRPKVLILFDDSGSMTTMVEGQRPPYDPSRSDYQGGITGSEFNRIYWSTNGEPPDDNSNQWFDVSKNRCESSLAPLANEGFFQTGARRWRPGSTLQECKTYCNGQPATFWCVIFGGNVTQECTTVVQPGSWEALSTSDRSPEHVDCEVDVVNGEAGNGPNLADGYPKDNVNNADVYSAATPAESNVNWGNTAYTFYSANYIDYINDDSLVVDRSRMEIAQDVIGNLVNANTGVDFALGTFNYNAGGGANGGRIIRRLIPDMDAADRSGLVGIIDNLTASGNTPLCETYYEAYRYITGNTVFYGDDRNAYYDSPERDLLAESGGTYIEPTSDCAYIYVILMTDGEPTQDTGANSRIETLTGKDCERWADGFNGTAENCLPELAEYMANNDLDGDATNGEQLAITYTIGFATDQPLLERTAALGGGDYYTATSADELANAFQGALLSIISNDSTFTAPGVAVDSFNRTQSRSEVFYAMFKPDQRVDWRGNLKKFNVSIVNGDPVVVDKNGTPAFDPVTGKFSDNVSSFWSTNDGGAVDKGGAGALLAARDPATRNILTNTGANGALEEFNSSNLTPAAYGLASNAELWSLFGVDNLAQFNAVIAWGRGYETSGGAPYTTAREWIMGDVLHSEPVPVNYGALGGFDQDNPDQRILVGTNSGFVHMFGNDDGQEDWAFFPKELADVLNKRRVNAVSADNVYGVDLTPTVFRQDKNRDGTIDAAVGDKAYAYFGLRRGGRILYALDISNPDAPAIMWQANPFTAGLGEMGDSWSRPVVARIPGYSDANGPKPVVIFGAGYDVNKDSTGVGTPDSVGRGVFILDAVTGTLVRSITPAASSPAGPYKNVQETGLLHSVPGEVVTLDNNGDDLVDRLYFGDTGGNVWRLDIGASLPTAGEPEETWFVTQLADLNGSTLATDRRFFNKPDIVRVILDEQPMDMVLIGSGDRTNPLAKDVDNFFYLLRDLKTTRYGTASPTAAECDPDDPANLPLDFRCLLPITQNGLFDITSNVLNTGTEAEVQAATADLASAAGWKFELVSPGEKNLSDSVTVGGAVVFSTFAPIDIVTNINVCEPVSGQGKRYFVNIFSGGGIFDDPNDPNDPTDPYDPTDPNDPSGPECSNDPRAICTRPGEIPPRAPPYVTPQTDDEDCPGGLCDPKIVLLAPPDGEICTGGSCDPGVFFPAPNANYWYSEDY